jgi:hypothetical protein
MFAHRQVGMPHEPKGSGQIADQGRHTRTPNAASGGATRAPNGASYALVQWDLAPLPTLRARIVAFRPPQTGR